MQLQSQVIYSEHIAITLVGRTARVLLFHIVSLSVSDYIKVSVHLTLDSEGQIASASVQQKQ